VSDKLPKGQKFAQYGHPDLAQRFDADVQIADRQNVEKAHMYCNV
jgi:hypothetical protein